MWVAHIAPGLVAKPSVPNVPLWVLTLAGALPDALHLILTTLTLSSCGYNVVPATRLSQVQQQGCCCFPYSANYPFIQSLLGVAVVGLVYAGIYSAMTDRRVTIRDQVGIIFTVTSHFILELPARRKGLLSHPTALFILEMAILYSAFLVWHIASPPFARAGAAREPWLPRALLGLFALEEAYFCFGPALTVESRFIYAPTLLGEIILNSYLIGRLD